MGDQEKSDKLREDGNELYKSGKLVHAIQAYRSALKITPSDARPLSNLSSAYFELGHYADSREHAVKALGLLANEDQTKTVQARIQALRNRLEKCLQYLQGEQVSPETKYKLSWLPRYRPSILQKAEYFSFGHDTVESLWDHHIDRYAGPDDLISFFFAGVGDARNLFGTLVEIVQFENDRPGAPKRNFHCTINDLKSAPIARDLIMLVLLQDLAQLDETSSNSATMLLSTLFYVFHGAIMPKVAFAQMQLVIKRLIKALEEGTRPLQWVHVRREDVPLVLRSLQTWQKDVVDAYSTSAMVDRVIACEDARGYATVPSYMKTEEFVYNHSGVLYPAKYILAEHERELDKLLRDAEKLKPKSLGKKVAKLVRSKWSINPTMVDVDWQGSTGLQLDVGHDPFGSIARFYEAGIIDKGQRVRSGSLYEILSPFFIETAKAMRKLEGRILVEAVLGDFAQVMEQIRLEVTDKRGKDSTEKFPVKYDRVHLSNIPDYVGGFMTPFLYSFPMLKSTRSSWITGNCLKNSGSWKNIEEYNAEYLLVPDLDTLEKLLQVKLLSRGSEGSFFQMTEYHRFGILSSDPWPYAKLLGRAAYKKWMYCLFFKIALPWYRDSWNARAVILAPLNLTILFRLLPRLTEVGYPPHWLSESINNILGDNVTTSGRPPQKMPTIPDDVREDYPSRPLTTGPFVAEMACLCALFRPLLPFRIEHPMIPPADSIYEYVFDLRDSDLRLRPDIFNLVLIFWDHSMFIDACDGGPPDDIRPLLDPSWGEVDPKMDRQSVQALREKGIAVWSTFQWDGVRKEAKAMMDQEFVEMCKSHKWWMGLWRTDFWCRAFERPVEVRFAVQRGARWIED